jgi:hypothetical protein
VIMGKLLGWSRRKRAEQTRRYQEFAAATSQALLPGPASPPAEPPARPEPPAQPRSWRRSRVHGQPQEHAPEPEPATPVPVPALSSGGWAPIPRSPYSRSLRPYPRRRRDSGPAGAARLPWAGRFRGNRRSAALYLGRRGQCPRLVRGPACGPVPALRPLGRRLAAAARAARSLHFYNRVTRDIFTIG